MIPAIRLSKEEKERITQRAKDLGASQVTYLNIKDYKSPASPDPKLIVHPEIRSFIIMAFPELRGTYMCQNYLRSFGFLGVDTQSLYAGMGVGGFIEENYDADAVILPIHRPFDVTANTFRRVIAPVSFRHAAVQSGMGVFGRNTLVVTPKWGAMVRFGVLATTLEIDSTPPLEGFNPCKGCKYPCVENCPVNAIDEEGKVLQHRCTKYSQPYDVGNYMRAQLKILDMDSEEKKEFIKSPHFFNLYQAAMGFLFYRCIECQRGCPMERSRPEYAGNIPVPRNATSLENPWDPKYDIFTQSFSYGKKEDMVVEFEGEEVTKKEA